MNGQRLIIKNKVFNGDSIKTYIKQAFEPNSEGFQSAKTPF